MSLDVRTILLYGRTRSGKSTLLAELAEWLKKTTGLSSLIYSIDKGGVGPMRNHIRKGIIDLVAQEGTNPWLFMSKASRGQVRDEKGKWVPTDLSQYAMVGIESITGFGDAFMLDMAEKAAQGINIGGQANVSFKVTGDGETINVGGSNMAHYNVAQSRIMDEFWRSQKLGVAKYIVWTAGASKEEDTTNGGKVVGPSAPGKALTLELPRNCDLCFRVDCLPASAGKEEEHILYMGNTIDLAAGNATSLGNTRVPLGADPIPSTIKPASLVRALELIEKAEQQASLALDKRMESPPNPGMTLALGSGPVGRLPVERVVSNIGG